MGKFLIAVLALVALGGGVIVDRIHSRSASGPVDTITVVTVKNCVQPPANINPDTLTPAQIRLYGLPLKPSDPAALATWKYIVTHIKQRGCTFLKHSLPISHPAKSLRVQPNASATGIITNYLAGNADIQRYYK